LRAHLKERTYSKNVNDAGNVLLHIAKLADYLVFVRGYIRRTGLG
jgi:hypothetical protein